MTDKIISRPATDAYKEGWNRIFGPDKPIEKVEGSKGSTYYPINNVVPYDPVSRPATAEYRDGYDRIFGKTSFSNRLLTPRELDEQFKQGVEDMVVEIASETAKSYEYVTYEIEGATRTPQIRAALKWAMRPVS